MRPAKLGPRSDRFDYFPQSGDESGAAGKEERHVGADFCADRPHRRVVEACSEQAIERGYRGRCVRRAAAQAGHHGNDLFYGEADAAAFARALQEEPRGFPYGGRFGSAVEAPLDGDSLAVAHFANDIVRNTDRMENTRYGMVSIESRFTYLKPDIDFRRSLDPKRTLHGKRL
jgi:hypothetical protein